MLFCPNCRKSFLNEAKFCSVCSWEPEMVEGIQVALSDSDRHDIFFKEYIDSYHNLSLEDMDHAIVERTYLANQADKMLSYYDMVPDSILEVGVGQGILLRKLRSKYPHANITAADISIPFLKHVKENVEVECLVANAENLPFQEEFDLVVASDILEHVINPIDFLLSSNCSLKLNGSLILRVPFEDNMLQYSRLLGCKHKFAHLRNFSKRNLTIMLRQAGFEVTKIHYDGYYAYCRRKFFWKRKVKGIFERFINWRYPNENDVSKIPNWLGFLLMRPLEIVVISKKARTVTSMNYIA